MKNMVIVLEGERGRGLLFLLPDRFIRSIVCNLVRLDLFGSDRGPCKYLFLGFFYLLPGDRTFAPLLCLLARFSLQRVPQTSFLLSAQLLLSQTPKRSFIVGDSEYGHLCLLGCMCMCLLAGGSVVMCYVL